MSVSRSPVPPFPIWLSSKFNFVKLGFLKWIRLRCLWCTAASFTWVISSIDWSNCLVMIPRPERMVTNVGILRRLMSACSRTRADNSLYSSVKTFKSNYRFILLWLYFFHSNIGIWYVPLFCCPFFKSHISTCDEPSGQYHWALP